MNARGAARWPCPASLRVTSGRRRSANSGFTLIEVAVVLGILALMAAVAVPAFRALVQEDDMTAATHRVEALFRLARDSAIRGGQPVTVVVDSVSGNVWLDTPTRTSVAADTVPRAAGSSLRLGSGINGGGMDGRAANDVPVMQGESLELPPAVRLELTRARARFTFAPGGSAFADSLVLRTVLESRTITVDRWTGDLRVH
jgi:prepilin-type N-terminal cleavage/methylation domain-containing protein